MVNKRKPRISDAALKEVEGALREYVHEIMHAGYGPMAQNVRVDNVDYFVSWLKHEFTPGERLERKPRAERGQQPHQTWLEQHGLLLHGHAKGPVWAMVEKDLIGLRLDGGEAGVVYLTKEQAKDVIDQLAAFV